MPTQKLEAEVRHANPRIAIVDLHGEINAFAEEKLFAAYAEAESQLQYPQTERGNEENQTSLPASPDADNSTTPNISRRSHRASPDGRATPDGQASPDSLAPSTDIILLNFSDVDYINSTGIALIVNLLTRARKAHHRLLACGLSDHYAEIFQITRLADFIGIFPDEASALAARSGSHS
jgi:anti-anti-sigma factor